MWGPDLPWTKLSLYLLTDLPFLVLPCSRLRLAQKGAATDDIYAHGEHGPMRHPCGGSSRKARHWYRCVRGSASLLPFVSPTVV